MSASSVSLPRLASLLVGANFIAALADVSCLCRTRCYGRRVSQRGDPWVATLTVVIREASVNAARRFHYFILSSVKTKGYG